MSEFKPPGAMGHRRAELDLDPASTEVCVCVLVCGVCVCVRVCVCACVRACLRAFRV